MSMYSNEEIMAMSVTDIQLNLELFFGEEVGGDMLQRAANLIKEGKVTWAQVETAVDGGGLPDLLK